MSPQISHFGVKYSNSVLKCLSFIKMHFVSLVQIKVLVNDLALLLDLFGNSKGTKLLTYTIIFCLVFTAPEKWRVELRAKTGKYRNRCLRIFQDLPSSEADLVYLMNWLHSKLSFKQCVTKLCPCGR